MGYVLDRDSGKRRKTRGIPDVDVGKREKHGSNRGAGGIQRDERRGRDGIATGISKAKYEREGVPDLGTRRVGSRGDATNGTQRTRKM